MTGRLTVLVEGIEAGEMVRDARGRVRFAYAPQYPAGATPISLSMPAGAHDLHIADAWLEGLVPDNAEILESWVATAGARSSHPFDLVATDIGWECAGAVQFCRKDSLGTMIDRGGGVEPMGEMDVASRLRALEEDGARWHGDPGGMFSLSGAQPKMALRLEDGRWGQPWGDEPTTHILKPPRSHLDRRVTRSIHVNEHLCQAAARELGIRAARTWLDSFEGRETLVVERFDRLAGRRIHTEDLCQALAVRPRHKYQYDGGPGPAEIARLLRDAAQPGDDLRFFDALAYNWLIGATDAHAKNFGVVLTGSHSTLAPIYDTASWIPYTDDANRYRFAMTLGRDYRLVKDNPARDWAETAREMGLPLASAIDRIMGIAARLPGAFEASLSGIPGKAFGEIAVLLAESIVAHAERNRQALERGNL